MDSSRVLDEQYVKPGPGRGAVRFVRDSGFFGGGLDVLVYVDGRQVATVDSNRVLVLYVPAGRRVFGVQAIDTTFPMSRLEEVVVEGGTVDLRVGFGSPEKMTFKRIN